MVLNPVIGYNIVLCNAWEPCYIAFGAKRAFSKILDSTRKIPFEYILYKMSILPGVFIFCIT